MNQEQIIQGVLKKIYIKDVYLFEQKLCERCIVFRFAHYLQESLDIEKKGEDWVVDCDFNKSLKWEKRGDALHLETRNGKPIDNEDGTITNRFIDVIVHKRGKTEGLLCIEFKTEWSEDRGGQEKDKNNLKVLTAGYVYPIGFHITFGENKAAFDIYEGGEKS